MIGRRLAVICDLREEGWSSMDWCGHAVVESFMRRGPQEIIPRAVQPLMVRRFSRYGSGRAFLADRLINRYWDYPRNVRRLAEGADLFHVADHSYAQLVHALPEARTVVTCHDADTFRSLTHPADERRPLAFRLMVWQTLTGLRKAARVCCVSGATRQALEESTLVKPDRLRVVPNPIRQEFSPRDVPADDERLAEILGAPAPGAIEILHVGSTAPRKRIDVLLNVVARLQPLVPGLRLIRVGSVFTSAQSAMIDRLGIGSIVRVLPGLDVPLLASAYRRAAAVLLTPEREGFCLPVAEALASGTPVVATDLPVIREVGGDVVRRCGLNDLEGWTNAVLGVVKSRQEQGAEWRMRREEGLARACRFSLDAYAESLLEIYGELA